jgi:uncharacterized protein (DUF1501 family)
MEPAMSHHEPGQNCSCDEFHEAQLKLSRRGFIGGVLALGGGILINEGGLEYALADTGSGTALGDIVINLNMRGGMDGLLAVAPLGDASLRSARPTLALPDSALLPLDGFFGMHPSLAGLKDLFDQKELSLIHAAGTPIGTRSHFDDQLALELAAYDAPTTVGGWQARLLANTGAAQVFSGVAVGQNVPASLNSATQAVAFENKDRVLLRNINIDRADQLAALRSLHQDSGRLWSAAARSSIDASLQVEGVTTISAVAYPNTTLGNRFKLLAQLIKGGLPIRTANIDFDGHLDVHAAAGSLTGVMPDNFKNMADSIQAFKADLGPLWTKTTVVTVTEFGRRVAENAQAGLDHGWGSVMFVMGGSVNGGKIVAKWPGLASNQLSEGDLPVTTDYRSVLTEVMTVRGGVSAVAMKQIFPNFAPQTLGLFA